MNSRRICDRLQDAREKERDPHLRDDLSIAWLTVLWLHKGIPQWIPYPGPPHVAATYQVLHCHPDDVWACIEAERKARLGREYSLWYFPDGTLRPDVIIPDYDPLDSCTMHTAPDGWQDRPYDDRRQASAR